MDDKEKILELEKKSALDTITSGCEMITELEQIDKVRNIFQNPVFLAEFCKKIGFDWKRLAQNLSINQIEIDSIEYAYTSLEMRAYVMLTKYEICKPEDMIRALNCIEREDLVDEIERLTNISKDILFKISGNSAAEKSSGSNLESDQEVQINLSLHSILLKNKINSLYKKGTDKIRTFNANDVKIDLGVKELNEAINNITNNQELLNDKKIAERLFDSYIFIGDIYTSTCYSKFQGNIYTNKAPEKYKEAIKAYESGYKYSEILHNDFQHDRFLHKLVTILNKPTDYGYDETVRDQIKYNEYFVKYKYSIRYRYEEGMRCLKECDFINAVYFFEKEIKNSKCLESKGCSLMHVAMTFHFKNEKTDANFQKAVSYYNEAIDIFINQGATDITGDVTCCYYYLCKLFSNPSSYGFDSVLKDVNRAAEIFYSNLNYIEGNVYRLLIQAEIYACKRFPWIQDKTDLDTDKVLDYCKRALNASNVNHDIKTRIYYLMTYTYSSLITEKNFDVYFNAMTCCQKALKTFKTGRKQKDQEYAERIVTESIALAHFPKTRGFEDINKSNSKPLRDVLDEIYESKDYKIIHFKEMKNYLMLHGFDPTIEKRVKNICIAEISVNSGNKSKEFIRSVSEAKEIVISTTNKLKEIEKNRDLYYYYFGFMKTFSKSYIAALAVTSGQLAIDTDNIAVKISAYVIDLIPFFGNSLATSMTEVINYLKSNEIRNAAINLSLLSSRTNEFEDMIQDIIVEIMFDNKEKFLTKSFDHKAKTWFEKINNFCRSIFENIEEAIYVPEFPEDMHKLGHRDAVKIIKKDFQRSHIW